jgi:2-polyprenyl-6-methoxyphenol hydroxylase-like FAD-dependent oxidoreductase
MVLSHLKGMALPAKTDLLIVGAGPTGLALASELKRQNVDCLIIDRQAAGANTSRACVVHARTLEVLQPLGLATRLLEQGIRVPIFRIRERDRTLLTIDFAIIDSGFPYTLMCPQDRVERCLLETLLMHGGRVERPCEFTHLTALDSHVDAEVHTGGATATIRAKWLVGCDGMHSAVREEAGIEFLGAAYEEVFVLGDVRMAWPLERNEVTLFYSPAGFMVVAPLPDERFRIVAMVDQAPESPSRDMLQSLLDLRGPGSGRIHEVVWSSRFRIHHRVAKSPRHHRILLCGDAAHVHSPAGGQGMNTGIQDSLSLAGILADVIGGADESLLDEWAAGRHRIASEIVTMTDRMTRMAKLKSPTAKSLRNLAVAFAGHLPPVREALARRLAEIERR